MKVTKVTKSKEAAYRDMRHYKDQMLICWLKCDDSDRHCNLLH